MDLPEAHIKEVDRKLVETIITALREDLLSAEEYDEVADFVVKGMDAVKTRDQLLEFLRALSAKWKIFTHLLVVEGASNKDSTEDKVYDTAVALAESGKIDEAVAVAKSATQAPVEIPAPQDTVAPVAAPVTAVVTTQGGQVGV